MEPWRSLGDPWACFGGLGADVGAPGGLLEALGEHFGALGVVSGPRGSAPGIVLGVTFVSSARAVDASIWLCVNLVFLGTFLFASFTNFAKWQRSLPHEIS